MTEASPGSPDRGASLPGKMDVGLWIILTCGMLVLGVLISKLGLALPEAPQVSEGATAPDPAQMLLEMSRGEWLVGIVLLAACGVGLVMVFRFAFVRHSLRPSVFAWWDLVTVAMAWLFFQAGAVLFVSLLHGGGLSDESCVFEILLLVGGATVGFVLLLGVLKSGRLARELFEEPGASLRNVGAGAASYLLALPFLALLLVLVNLFAQMVGWQNLPQPIVERVAALLARGGWPAATVILAVMVAAPVSEELFFRGLLQPILRNSVGPTWAIFGAALLFAVLHMDGAPSPFLLLILALGILLGTLRELTGQLFPAIAVHMLHNGLNLLILTFS